jgi:uncharacterized protein
MRIISEKQMIPGAIGQLETLLDSSNQPQHPYLAICCHPHPQHAGSMTNKVIHTAARALAGIGIPSIRFNFRGVGASDGKYADAIGEQDDLVAVVCWANEVYPDHRIILAGFSFGAYVSAMQASNIQPELLISIAPPVGRIEFDDFVRPSCPWLLIQGEVDELVDAEKVLRWAESFSQPPKIVKMPETSHFFHGKLVALRESIESFTRHQLNLG